MKKKALIIGAGPAGLTAAYELLTRTNIVPVIIEKDHQVGGLAKTIQYKGNRIDIGGHRFFSKSDRIIQWWLRFLPLDPSVRNKHIQLSYQQKQADFDIDITQFGQGDNIMLLRERKSRIYYQHQFFDYPLKLDIATIRKLGWGKTILILLSYCSAKLLPVQAERNLEEFFCNRFGKKLYETFFKDYTEKVWGIPCAQIPASWGAQRIRDLNISKMIAHAFVSLFKTDQSLHQRNTATSLIERFLYPKFGPGQMWESVAAEILRLGGEIYLNTDLDSLTGNGSNRIISATVKPIATHQPEQIEADYFFSTMPVKELMDKMNQVNMEANLKEIGAALKYRDFLIVGILVPKQNVLKESGSELTDNWIYIQDRNVKAGRLQIFNNWSPYMVCEEDNFWFGVEYFCNVGDEFWEKEDDAIIRYAVNELQQIGILKTTEITDAMVSRVHKAYPSYDGGYEKFEILKNFLNTIDNLYLIGRNGMHRYNNSDHSMLTAMAAVDNIIAGKHVKDNIWDINTDEEYHEEK